MNMTEWIDYVMDLPEPENFQQFEHPQNVYKYMGSWRVQVVPDSKSGDPGFYAVEVPSSDKDKDPYTVIVEKDLSMSCGCKGWAYRNSCRHVTMVKAFYDKKT